VCNPASRRPACRSIANLRHARPGDHRGTKSPNVTAAALGVDVAAIQVKINKRARYPTVVATLQAQPVPQPLVLRSLQTDVWIAGSSAKVWRTAAQDTFMRNRRCFSRSSQRRPVYRSPSHEQRASPFQAQRNATSLLVIIAPANTHPARRWTSPTCAGGRAQFDRLLPQRGVPPLGGDRCVELTGRYTSPVVSFACEMRSARRVSSKG
jgi:hypothetical protein